MPDAPPPATTPNTSPLRLVAVVIGLVIVALLAFQIADSQMRGSADETSQLTMRAIGLTSPTVNELDAAFIDSNRDLVADGPADADAAIDPETLVFSFIPTKGNDERYMEVFADFTSFLSDRIGRPVKAVAFESSDDQMRALRNGDLHVTLFNTGAVPIAVNAAGFVPAGAPGLGEPQSYRMLIIVPTASPIQQVADLRGRELTLTHPNSNSGYKAPIVTLYYDFKMKPNQDYLIVSSWGHETSIRDIVAGEAEAAAVASDLLDRMIASGRISSSDFRVVYQSPPFPSAAIGYSALLNDELKSQITNAIGEFNFTGTSLAEEYPATRADRFAPVSYKDDFALVRRIDDAIGFEHKLDEPVTLN
ncbi:MAG: phosphate/phosphite/phosphonate ABC transporter substrate-binding protein [Planctomycetota bacterium]